MAANKNICIASGAWSEGCPKLHIVLGAPTLSSAAILTPKANSSADWSPCYGGFFRGIPVALWTVPFSRTAGPLDRRYFSGMAAVLRASSAAEWPAQGRRGEWPGLRSAGPPSLIVIQTCRKTDGEYLHQLVDKNCVTVEAS